MKNKKKEKKQERRTKKNYKIDKNKKTMVSYRLHAISPRRIVGEEFLSILTEGPRPRALLDMVLTRMGPGPYGRMGCQMLVSQERVNI